MTTTTLSSQTPAVCVGPTSLRAVLADLVPPLVECLQQRGGPTDEDLEAVRLFAETLASKGDAVLFPLEAFKDREQAAALRQALAQHVATAAFCPGGITPFGLRVAATPTSLSIEEEGACAGEFPVDAKGTRKTTGSFYTPMELITAPGCLLDTALEPVIKEACAQEHPEEALLSLSIADPSCGSGAFPYAASERLAQRLARVRYGEKEPTLMQWREIRRAIVARCLYAVDLNPAAVELCKLTLSFQAIDPAKPFPYLDAHILRGNGIIGTDFASMSDGIPDAALEPILGDDPALARAYKKRNKAERADRQGLFTLSGPEGRCLDWEGSHRLLAQAQRQLDAMPDDTLERWHFKRAAHRCLLESDLYQWNLLRANAWCAAFVWKKTSEMPDAITDAVFRSIECDPAGVVPWMRTEIDRLAEHYQFFHWDIAFAQVLCGHTHFMAAERKRQREWVESMEKKRHD